MLQETGSYTRPGLRPKERIRLRMKQVDERGRTVYQVRTATVVKVYPHHVIIETDGRRECYQYYDIWKMHRSIRRRK